MEECKTQHESEGSHHHQKQDPACKSAAAMWLDIIAIADDIPLPTHPLQQRIAEHQILQSRNSLVLRLYRQLEENQTRYLSLALLSLDFASLCTSDTKGCQQWFDHFTHQDQHALHPSSITWCKERLLCEAGTTMIGCCISNKQSVHV